MSRTVLAASTALIALLIGCGGGSSSSSSTSSVVVTISPTSATIQTSATEQFSDTVTGSSNTSVTWNVNNVAGGDTTVGTVSTNGLYTAPASVPSSTITVTAVSSADSTKSAAAQVTLTASGTLQISPSSATVPAGGQQTFTVAASGQSISSGNGVSFTVSCTTAFASDCGTITADGIYTAPLSPPLGQSAEVTASSTTNSFAPSNASVLISFSNASLTGQYAFGLQGRVANSPFLEFGSVKLDGGGTVLGGTEDLVNGTPTTVTITGGSYSVGADGRTSMLLHTDHGDETWQIALVNHSHALAMRADSVVASGDFDLQNTAQFTQPLASNYAVNLSGESSVGIPLTAEVGAFAIDLNGSITSGLVDVNDHGTVSSALTLAGSVSSPSTTSGRGTVALTSGFATQNFAYYAVDPGHLKLVEIDGAHPLGGEAVQQSAGPPYATANFAGSFAFVATGATSQGAVGYGGIFTLDSSGNITTGTVDMTGTGGVSQGLVPSGSATTTDAGTGRTTLLLKVNGSTLSFVFYPRTTFTLQLLEVDSSSVTAGAMLGQSGNFLTGGTAPSLTSHFALLASESDAFLARTIAGAVVPNPAVSGTVDVNDAGTATLGSAVVSQSSSLLFTSQSGHGTLSLQLSSGFSSGLQAYLVDSGTVLVLESDGKAVVSGSLQRQF